MLFSLFIVLQKKLQIEFEKTIRYYLPPFVKHILPSQNDFGMSNNTW